jgi:3-methylfumaryl-CoA hydratase
MTNQTAQTRTDVLTRTAIAALQATLDTKVGGTPALAHWMLFAPLAAQSELGADGHPRRGGFMPDLGLPRRMWAGGRLTFHSPLPVGEEIVRESRIAEVTEKSGRSGRLAFVAVHHRLSAAGQVLISEEQDIVYREAPAADAPPVQGTPAPDDEAHRRRITADPVLLFRYSALTFNAHRIHYDQAYATAVEGYPGLVVHGPLIATLLAELAGSVWPGSVLKRFAFKAIRPLFHSHAFELCAKPGDDGRVALWARDHQGMLAMQADAQIG